jgi:hypothetical protein
MKEIKDTSAKSGEIFSIKRDAETSLISISPRFSMTS